MTYTCRDLINALERERQCALDVHTIYTALFGENMAIYWYRRRRGLWYRQEGFIQIAVSGRGLKVINSDSKKESWLSLYDLRFYLHGTTPQKVVEAGENPTDSIFLLPEDGDA